MARQTNKPTHYRQSITLVVNVIVVGTEKQFNVLTDDLREAVEEYVLALLPGALLKGLVECTAQRGPSGSRYYHPSETLGEEGVHVPMASLGVPTVEVD